MTAAGPISVGIASRNRATSLVRCIASLEVLGDLVAEVIVVDDGSDVPVEPLLREQLTQREQRSLRVERIDPARGLAAARTLAVRLASTPWVLNLDDDTVVISVQAVDTALKTLTEDPELFAVAFAQAELDGTPWPASAQPAPVTHPCRAASFIGFAHLVRRDTFLALGGYREQLIINGEERELCLRALDAGYGVVYLPDARVAHLADPTGRDTRRYLHLTVRNGVLSSIYDDPFLLACVRLPTRLFSYFRMRGAWKVQDRGGFRTIMRWILTDLRRALAQRRPVRWATIRRWRALVRHAPPYRRPT